MVIMKNITVKNINKAAQMIMEKGYDRCEAVNLAWQSFRTARENNFIQPVEFYIDNIVDKASILMED